ncbi:DoxX family protein [Candidatus Woesearchaeota archaeon]|nr:DoxX family protein [Candidatus Woesearchaeota archaeon]
MVTLDTSWASISLRLVLAAILVVHGYPKLKNFKQTVGFVGSLGFWPAKFWAFMLGIAELLGGIAILVGLFSRIFAGILIIVMCVATYAKVFKWKVPFTKMDAMGWEYDVMILAALIALFLLGSGAYSIDGVMGWIWG